MLGEVAVSTAGVMLCWGKLQCCANVVLGEVAVSTVGGSCSVYCRCNVVLGEVAVSTCSVGGSVSTAGVMLCWGKLQCLLQV